MEDLERDHQQEMAALHSQVGEGYVLDKSVTNPVPMDEVVNDLKKSSQPAV